MLTLVLLSACPEPEPQWFSTCGDPSCSGYSGPFEGVPLCTDETEGEVCDPGGASCDPVDDCNTLLLCTTEDPKDQTGGCPVSRAAFKRGIRYLSAEETAEAGRLATGLRLATWNYRWEAEGSPTHLGFVIDDLPGIPAVTADGNHVDLYGYTSLTLAATQAQARVLAAQEAQIDVLEQRVQDQERRLAEQALVLRDLRARVGAMEPPRAP